MPDLEGGEHVVVYRAVADFRELLAAVAKAKAELKALSSDTTGKAGAAGGTERLKRDLDTYTRARVEGSKQAAVAEALVAASHKKSADAAKVEAEATQKVAEAEKELAAASERTAKVSKARRSKAEIDAEKALIQAEKELEQARARAEEAAARHTLNTKEVSNARSALTRATKTSTDTADAEQLRAALSKVADVQERITRAVNARDASKPDLAQARSAQRQAEQAAEQLRQVAAQATTAAEGRRATKAAVPPQPQQQETGQPTHATPPGARKAFDVDEVLREYKAALTKDQARSVLSGFSRAELTEVAKKEQLPRAGNAIPDAPLPKTRAALTEHLVHQVREARPAPTGPVHDPTRVDEREYVDKATGRLVPQPSQVDIVRGQVVPKPTVQTPAAVSKPVLRRGKVPTQDEVAGLSTDDLVQGMGQYSGKSKTGQLLRSESHRRTTNAILSPAPDRAAPPLTASPAAAPQPDPQQALERATTRTASAEEKLASAKDKVAAQEELLADAKHQFLQARGDAERIRAEVQNAATRTGVTLTPEQLAGNKHVRAADEARRGAQQPVKDTHADLVAARELQSAAESAVTKARQVEAAARSAAPARDHDDALPAAFQHLLEQITQAYQERHQPSPELSQGQVRDLGAGRSGTDPRTEDVLVARLRELNSSVGKDIELRTKGVEPVQKGRGAASQVSPGQQAEFVATAAKAIEAYQRADVDFVHAKAAFDEAKVQFDVDKSELESAKQYLADSVDFHKSVLALPDDAPHKASKLKDASTELKTADAQVKSGVSGLNDSAGTMAEVEREYTTALEARTKALKTAQAAAPTGPQWLARGVAKVPTRNPISAATQGDGHRAWEEYDRRHGSMGGVTSDSEESEALHSYMGSGYHAFNEIKRQGQRPLPPGGSVVGESVGSEAYAQKAKEHLARMVGDRQLLLKQVEQIDAVFTSEAGKLKDDVTVFRGYQQSAKTTKPYQIGQVLHDPAYQSTSFDPQVAHDFGGVGGKLRGDHVSHVLEIQANKGQEGIHLDNQYERELLLRRGQYQITGAKVDEDETHGRKFRSYQARLLGDEEFADLNKRQTQAKNLRAFSSFQAQGQLIGGDSRLQRSVEQGLTNLRKEIDSAGKELELFRRPVAQAGVETSSVSAAMHHFQDGLDRVNQSLAVQRSTYDDISAKTKFFADRLDHVTAVTDEEFQATRRFREGLDQVDRTLRTQAEQRLRQPALESAPAVGDRNLKTFAQSIVEEIDRQPKRVIESGPTGATASYWESLDRNVRHVNDALERHSVDRFNTGLDKVVEDMRQTMLGNFRHGLEELHTSVVGTTEEFGKFNKAIDDVDFRLQSNYRARPPAIPRQTDQDVLRRQATPGGGGDGGGVVAMRRDDLQKFLDEVKKIREEPNFTQAPTVDSGARQQRPTDEGREHRHFHAEEGEVIDDRPPYEPMRRQLPSGLGGHDTLFAPSSYPGSGSRTGAFTPGATFGTPGNFRPFAPDTGRGAYPFMDPAFTGYGTQRYATMALGSSQKRQRGPFLSQSSFDTARSTRKRRQDDKRRSEGARSFPNVGRAIGDVFSSGGRQRSPQAKDRLQDVADVAPRLGENFNRWTKIIIAVTTAVVALIPAIALVSAAFGTLLAAAGGAVAAVGVFALAAYANFSKLKTAIDDAAKSGRPLAQQYQTVGAAFARLQSVYAAFQRATQGPVFAVFTDALNLATRLLPRFTPVVEAAGKAIQGALGQLDAASQTDTFSKFLEFISTYGVTAIGTFTKAALSLGQGLAELAIAFGPYISYFTEGLASLAGGFEKFAASASGSADFKEFMKFAQDNAPKVGSALSALVEALAHLGAALAPIGGALLTVISALAEFVSVLPTGALTALIGGFVATWIAIRLLLVVVAVTKAIAGFRDALVSLGIINKVATALEFFGIKTKNAAGELNTFKVAALGLVGALGIIALVTLLTVGISRLSAAQDAAAESTKRHTDAVQRLAEALRGSGGAYTADVKNQASSDLVDKQDVTVHEGGRYDVFGIGDKKLQSSVADVAQKAGVPLRQASAGLTGDQKAQDQTKTALAGYAKEQQQALDDFNKAAGGQAPDSDQKAKLEESAAAAAAASKRYNELAVSATEVSNVNSQFAQTQQKVTDATTQTITPLKDLNIYTKELATNTTDSQTAIATAITAYDAYNQAVKDAQRAHEAMAKASIDSARSVQDAQQRIANASQAVIEAQQSEKEAQENLTKAREDAAAQLEDYRRTLRDIPLDEEQASINLQKSIDNERKARNAPGATGLDLRQATLDRERAQNSYSDTLTDDVRKKTDANRGLTKTVSTSDNVIDATNALKDATTALGNANQEFARAQQDLPFVQQAAKEAIQDAQTAFDVATKKVGETATALQNASTAAGVAASSLADVKAKQQALEHDVTINLSLNDKNNTVTQLQNAAIALQALKLLAADPTLSIQAAYEQAAAIVATNTNAVANKRANAGFGGKGQSQGSAGKAAGGAIEGAGTATSDSILTPLSTGEHVWTAAEVIAVGGHTMVKAIREAALHRKSAATSPGQYEMAAGLLRVAKVPGRTAGYDPVQLSSAMFTAGLNVAAATGPSLAPVSASTRPVVINNTSVHHHGVSTGDITINNPVKEQAGGSLYRTLRRMRRDYD